MLDLKDLSTHEFSTLCQKAGEVCSHRYAEIARASDPTDQPLQELLEKMSREAQVQSLAVEQEEEKFPEDDRPVTKMEEILAFIRTSFESLGKRLGEGFLHRDISLFL